MRSRPNGDLSAGGSYDTYLAPGRSASSMVAQTSVATAAQQVTVRVTGGLPARVVHVWRTSLRGPGQFIQRGDIIPHKGAFVALLQPGYVYTLTTTTGQSRAAGHAPAVPAAGPMPVRYTATPDRAGLADMLAPVEGSFGYVQGVLTLTAAGEPVEWQYPGRSPAPYAIVGQNTWRDYTVSARVILPAPETTFPAPGATLIARFGGFGGTTLSQFRGYELMIRSKGAWRIVASGPAAVTLASGRVAAARALRTCRAGEPRLLSGALRLLHHQVIMRSCHRWMLFAEAPYASAHACGPPGHPVSRSTTTLIASAGAASSGEFASMPAASDPPTAARRSSRAVMFAALAV
jgi:hypothetical protein